MVGWGLFRWVYNNHIPRAAFSSSSFSLTLTNTAVNNNECTTTIFPFPTNEDFELDSIDPTCNNKKAKSGTDTNGHDNDGDTKTIGPHFTTPGGTAIFGTFAYSISSDAYHTLINALQNDAGALCWKGKRMRAYQAKPIDKIIPRHVKSEFGPNHIHIPNRVAFVRCPMLGSLLHPQWEEGFCNSTELQYQLSCHDNNKGDYSNTSSNNEGSNVWDHVWLTEEEREVVSRRKKSGKWEVS